MRWAEILLCMTVLQWCRRGPAASVPASAVQAAQAGQEAARPAAPVPGMRGAGDRRSGAVSGRASHHHGDHRRCGSRRDVAELPVRQNRPPA